MTTTAIREKLQDYIRFADTKMVKALYTLLEHQINTAYKNANSNSRQQRPGKK